MKKALSLVSFFWLVLFLNGQHLTQRRLDSLLALYSAAKKDTQQVWTLAALSIHYDFNDPDSGLFFARKQLELSERLNYKEGITDAKKNMAIYWWVVGEYPLAVKLFTENIEYFTRINDVEGVADQRGIMFNIHRDQGDYKEAFADLRFSDSISQVKYSCKGCVDSVSLGSIFYELKQYDSALFYLKAGESVGKGWNTLMLGKTYSKLGDDRIALQYYLISIRQLINEGDIKDLAGAYNALADLYKKINKNDSALYYSKTAVELAQQKKFNREALQSYLTLVDIYNSTDPQLAFKYLRLAFAAKDSLYNQDKQRQLSAYKLTEELNRRQAEASKKQYQTKLKTAILFAALGFFIIISIVLYRNNRQKQAAKKKVETAYDRLKATQAQLIQSEKMASLGELTAGIAHEIQNPLNFVNNFSDVNAELIDEAEQEMAKGNIDQAQSILNDIKDNEQKINHHGKRADSIVKGMLQHSRTSTGQKELTDINKLADEYLRLAYHGLRAKDKSFNAEIKTDFDNSIGKINIVQQDMARALLNLINNAFYAANEKAKLPNASHDALVVVGTKRQGNKIEIKITDNGNGIPKNVVDKIFQPFFTTKPTGQGTGLGLSLAYDIIKAHGGEITINTKEGEGSEFAVRLPAT